MFLSWVAVSVAGALVPPAAALRSAQVTASPPSATKQMPPEAQAGSGLLPVDTRAREDRAKSVQKPVPPVTVVFCSRLRGTGLDDPMPWEEPVGRVVFVQLGALLDVINEPSGTASQLY